MAGSSNVRYLSTDSNKVDEPFKVQEAETVNIPPPPTEKVSSCEDCRFIYWKFILYVCCMRYCIPLDPYVFNCHFEISYLCWVETDLLARIFVEKL